LSRIDDVKAATMTTILCRARAECTGLHERLQSHGFSHPSNLRSAGRHWCARPRFVALLCSLVVRCIPLHGRGAWGGVLQCCPERSSPTPST
jgi:hypothetical protein